MDNFFDFSNEMLCVADRRGYFIQVNLAWTKTLGWTIEELSSRPYVDFVHPDDLEATTREASMLLSGSHETIRFENRYRCRDGSYRWLAWKARFDSASHQIVAAARDVTVERSQAEALRESEERFRTLATHAPIGIAQSNAEGSIFYVNRKWCELAGVTPEEALGFQWKTFIHPEDFSGVVEAWQSSLRAGKDMPPFEFRFLHRNGDIRWAKSSVSLIKNPDGAVVSQIAALQDITEQKHAETVLRQTEERFRLLAMHAPVGITQSDPTGVVFVNPKACEIAGSEPAEIVGAGWLNFLHPEDLGYVIEQFQADMAAQAPHSSADYRIVRKDGTTRWVKSIASPIHDDQGAMIGQIGITEDITDRKTAEDALRTKESQLRGILDNTTAVIYLKDLEGRYILVNRRHKMLFQQKGEAVTGRMTSEIHPFTVARRLIDADRKVIQEQAPLVFEEVAHHEDGPHTYRSIKFPVLDDAGEMIAIGGISTDISDLKEAHEALKNKEELLRNLIEVQENEKQRLCHEFHDGLIQYAVSVKMLLESSRRSQPSLMDSAILEEAISDLRSGIDDGRRTLRGIRPAVLDDSDLNAAIQDLINHSPAPGIMVTFDCDPQIGRLPESIQTTVYRVVQEALTNARKHSGTDVVRINLQKSNGTLSLEVRDFGCGFDPRTARSRGFGLLGMTERVRLLGGECVIRSETDEGTWIRVCLPLPVTHNGDG